GRRGQSGSVVFDPVTLHYRVKFSLPEPLPLISIIIPSKDAAALCERCLKSIVDISTYKPFEIVVSDNGSTAAATFA
ncbi:glycosyltransferase family 2 protein, partial [Enterococcus faecalis]|uniref:glycosyltransferase family 2 protein n=1 Tax=Enterococcus faecalis TaxID=1351 RepID=UPI0040395E36